jgi:hypothetical protein
LSWEISVTPRFSLFNAAVRVVTSPDNATTRTPAFSVDADDAYQHAVARQYSVQSQLEAMDVEGLTAAVLFPSMGLTLMDIDGVDPVMTTAIASAYNRWLSDFCSQGQGGSSRRP